MTNKRIFGYIFDYLKPYKWLVVIALFAILFVSLSILSLGIAIKELINQGLKDGNSYNLDSSIIYIFSLIIILGIASFIRSFSINTIGEKVINDIRIKLYNHLLTLKFHEFEKIKVTDITAHLSNDLELISRIIVDVFSFCVRNSIMFVGGIILMFFQSVKLSLIALLIVPIMLILFLKLGKKIRILAREIQHYQGHLYSDIAETFSGIAVIYAFNAQSKKAADLQKKSKKLIDLSVKRLFLRSGFFALAIIAIMTSILFVIWIGSLDVINQTLNPGNLVSFIFYASSSAMSIGGIAEVISEFWRCLAGAERIFSLLENKEIESRNIKYLPIRENNTDALIRFSDVNFSYPSRKDAKVLSNLNFTINKGEFIGIVGPSGSGKSTIFQLLLKFFLSDGGEIFIHGKNLNSLSAEHVRSYLGYVAQNSFIFSESIIKNLEIASSNYDSAITDLGLDEIALRLPSGLNTYLGSEGAQLSGGQRQRIALARALSYNPEILLLDESTSAIDQENERIILNHIRKRMEGKTIISIAHRISSIEQADRILVVNNGSIISSGTHKKLLESCALYQKLYHVNN